MPLSNITGILQTVTPFLSSASRSKKKPGSLPPDLMNENCWDQRNQSSLIRTSLNRPTENSKVTPDYTVFCKPIKDLIRRLWAVLFLSFFLCCVAKMPGDNLTHCSRRFHQLTKVRKIKYKRFFTVSRLRTKGIRSYFTTHPTPASSLLAKSGADDATLFL